MQNIITIQENAQVGWKTKVVFIAFFFKEESVVHLEYALQEQTLNHHFCTQDISVM